MQGGSRDVVLYGITIDPHQSISMELSEKCKKAADEAVERILTDLNAGEE
jgi:Ni,Fe-hydrogenase maturation factor